jgi:hypothetical protein
MNIRRTGLLVKELLHHNLIGRTSAICGCWKMYFLSDSGVIATGNFLLELKRLSLTCDRVVTKI